MHLRGYFDYIYWSRKLLNVSSILGFQILEFKTWRQGPKQYHSLLSAPDGGYDIFCLLLVVDVVSGVYYWWWIWCLLFVPGDGCGFCCLFLMVDLVSALCSWWGLWCLLFVPGDGCGVFCLFLVVDLVSALCSWWWMRCLLSAPDGDMVWQPPSSSFLLTSPLWCTVPSHCGPEQTPVLSFFGQNIYHSQWKETKAPWIPDDASVLQMPVIW